MGRTPVRVPWVTSAPAMLWRRSDAVEPPRATRAAIGKTPPVEASTTRLSPARHFPTQMVTTFLGMRKYSTVRARANEFGGMIHTSPLKSTKDRGSKFLGSTIVELMLV